MSNLGTHVADNQRAQRISISGFGQNLELSAPFMFSLPDRSVFSSLISIEKKNVNSRISVQKKRFDNIMRSRLLFTIFLSQRAYILNYKSCLEF